MANEVLAGKQTFSIKKIRCYAGLESVEVEIDYENGGWELMTLDMDTSYELGLKLQTAVTSYAARQDANNPFREMFETRSGIKL